MKKMLFIVFFLVAFTLVLILLNRNKEAEPTPTASLTPTPQATTIIRDKSIEIDTGKSLYDVVITKNGASPQNLTIKVGDTVRFTNNDSALHWPASGVHPTHQICPGFDALRGLGQGKSYSLTFTFTFNEAQECPFHDHLNPGSSSLKGKITITE